MIIIIIYIIKVVNQSIKLYFKLIIKIAIRLTNWTQVGLQMRGNMGSEEYWENLWNNFT